MKYVVCFFAIVFIFLNSSAAFSAQGQRGTLGDESIAYTKHNLSSYWPADAPADTRTVTSSTTTELCVFCHTPHGSNVEDLGGGVRAPLWNRKLSTANYFLYDEVWSPTLDAYRGLNLKPSAPTGYSKLCLSCHDGTLAIGNVFNAPGSGGYSGTGESVIPLTGTDTGGTMPVGGGRYSGDTRLIGNVLQNDHPISFVYDIPLQNADGELAAPDTVIDPTDTRVPPKTLLYPGTTSTRDNVQCTSCHNPHTTYEKFLRMSRWQEGETPTTKQICRNCHVKPGWENTLGPLSSHRTSTKSFDATLPASNAGLENKTMANAGCLACHDTHTIQGAERLLRDAVDSATYTAGGNSVQGDKTKSAIENLCFRCHSRSSASLLTPHGLMDSNAAPPKDIWAQFNKTSSMPIADSAVQGNHVPIFTLSQPADPAGPTMPSGHEKVLLSNKHVECTDCHNPHRLTSSSGIAFSPIDRLAGMRGIKADGTVVQSVLSTDTGYRNMVEISEVCFRCHGDTYDIFIPNRYYSDAVRGLTTQPLRTTAGDPASNNTSGSNKRKEFDPNTTFPLGLSGTRNYNMSFHPVATKGRNQTGVFDPSNAARYGLISSLATVPFGRDNTMNCTDCHNTEALGTGTFSGTTASPNFPGPITQSSLRSYNEGTDNFPGRTQRNLLDISRPSSFFSTLTEATGPHGSSNNRILRANYDTTLAAGIAALNRSGNPPFASFNANNFALCFQCHNIDAFTNNNSQRTNFRSTPGGMMCPANLNLHALHLCDSCSAAGAQWEDIGNMYTACANCHYNVHSNVEAGSTTGNTIYGDGNGGALPPHNGTRLVNFSPIIQPNSTTKPRWWYDGTNMRCDLRCHNNVIMDNGAGGIAAVYDYFGN